MSLQNKSKIIGQAIVKFGGSILINIGYNDKTGATGLLFSETKEEHKPGEKLTEGEETYGGSSSI